MPRLSLIAIGLLALVSACQSPPVNRDAEIALTTAQFVEPEKYMGLWYEIARFPNSFEENCEGVTAEYALKDDGTFSVTNTCRKGSLDGKVEVANGRAKIVDTTTNAKLKVSFFGPFWGDYWILDLAEDYSLSLVGEPSGRYLWILSRTPQLEPATKARALTTLKALGYDTGALYFGAQPENETADR